MNSVITIGRQFGSGGHEVGSRLARKLNIPFYDKEILSITAQNSSFAESYLSELDEQKPAFVSLGSAASVAGSSVNLKLGSIFGSYYNLSSNDRVFLEVSKVIKSLAEKGPCVVVGRGSDYILRDYQSINIFVNASLKDRVRRKLALDENKDYNEESMEKFIITTDKNRSKYYEYYTHEKWGDSGHYDLCVNTSSVGIDGAVDVIAHFLEIFHKKSILPDK